MTVKRLTFYTSLVILVICVTGLFLFSAFLLFAPGYIEEEILPGLAKKAGINIVSLEIRNIGTGGAELCDIKIGNDQKAELKIDSIRIDYSLSGLLNRIIDRVVISGMSLTFEYRDNNVLIPGLDGLITGKEVENRKSKTSANPFAVKELRILNSNTDLIYNNKPVKIPFSLSTTLLSQNKLPEKIELKLYPGGIEVTVKGEIERSDKMLLSLLSEDFSLSFFEEFLMDYAPVGLKGKAGIKLSSQLLLSSFELTNISASLISDSLEINYSGVTLKNPAKSTPIELFIESEDAVKWQYQCSPVLISYPSQSLESDFEGRCDLSGGAVNARIMAKTVFAGDGKIPAILWDISAIQEEEKPLRIQLKGVSEKSGTSETFQIEAYGLKLAGESPDIQINAEYDETGLISSYRFALKNLKAHNNKMNFSAPLVSVKGNAGYVQEKGGQADISFSIESSKIMFNGYDLTAEIPEPVISGSIKYDEKSGINADARFSLDNGVVSGSVEPFKVTGLSGSIPFIWPFNKKGKEGNFYVKSLSYENFSAGPLETEILQEGNKIYLDGKLSWSLFPEMEILLSGNTSLSPILEQGKLFVKIPLFKPAEDINLKKFVPELADTYVNGKFKINSDISYASSNLTAEAYLEVDEGTLSNPENNLTLEQISCSLKLEDLFPLRSAPGQKLKIEKIAYGDIIAGDFNMDFRIDPAISLAVEQGEFNWADGEINIKPFKIISGKNEYDITLFCDRLKLAEILDQLGVAEASGSGTVNGKIPVKISRGKISFQDGFLYSTPGGGGKINITETDILTAGLSPGSPEYAQMDIAREALKAFDYSWVKMTLNSEKDELVMQLQFDGKPENKLPFRYNKEIGSFIRVDTDAQGSNFQGIRLDVNFRVPLNEILNYKDVLNMIE
ncbi:YdbH domain-containing protein [Thermodesulfobacteriota bacterium]